MSIKVDAAFERTPFGIFFFPADQAPHADMCRIEAKFDRYWRVSWATWGTGLISDATERKSLRCHCWRELAGITRLRALQFMLRSHANQMNIHHLEWKEQVYAELAA